MAPVLDGLLVVFALAGFVSLCAGLGWELSASPGSGRWDIVWLAGAVIWSSGLLALATRTFFLPMRRAPARLALLMAGLVPLEIVAVTWLATRSDSECAESFPASCGLPRLMLEVADADPDRAPAYAWLLVVAPALAGVLLVQLPSVMASRTRRSVVLWGLVGLVVAQLPLVDSNGGRTARGVAPLAAVMLLGIAVRILMVVWTDRRNARRHLVLLGVFAGFSVVVGAVVIWRGPGADDLATYLTWNAFLYSLSPAIALGLYGVDFAFAGGTRYLAKLLATGGAPTNLQRALRRGLHDSGLDLLLLGQTGLVDVRGIAVKAEIGPERFEAIVGPNGVAGYVRWSISEALRPPDAPALLSAAALAIEHRNLQLTVGRQIEDLHQANLGLAEAEFKARLEIGHLLHDVTQQYVVALRWSISAHPAEAPSCEKSEILTDPEHLAEDISRHLSEVIDGPAVGVLDREGLAGAVAALPSLKVLRVKRRIQTDRYPPGVEFLAYQVISEGLTNVLKHAFASSASVVVIEGGGVLNVEVADTGVGMPAIVHERGLTTLRNRILGVGGSFEVESANPGTVLRATIPMISGRVSEQRC